MEQSAKLMKGQADLRNGVVTLAMVFQSVPAFSHTTEEIAR